jgi:MoaA/NifB/PqqE/SkfB family radical SAM enzyme
VSKQIGLTKMLTRMASLWGSGMLRTLWKTRSLQAGLLRSRRKRRRALDEEGLRVPMGIAISPTMRCNLECHGCYARLHPRDGEMPIETIDALVRESSELGVFFYVITGGEPYLRPEMLDIYRRYRHVLFLTVTNGTLIDLEVASRLAGTGNVFPVVSIEGTRELTDGRRGEGVYDRVITCMDILKETRVPFGFSSVVTCESAATLGSEAFVSEMVDRGCTVGVFNEYIPIEPGEIDIVPDEDQRRSFRESIDRLKQKYPIILISLPDDEYDDTGRCMAVANGAVHITARGNVEPCPFAHFARENITRCSFRDVLESPFLSAIRSHPTALQCGEIGCALVSNRAILEEIAGERGARSTKVPAIDINT